nr:immunoglobulin heavy chain junction region [Mus musculus]
CARGLSMDYW